MKIDEAGALRYAELCLPLECPNAGPVSKLGSMPFNWRKYEAWRGHPMLTNNMRHSVPGLTWGLGAFAIYVAYDQLRPNSSSSDSGHH